jgi:hypothetical protein
MFSSTKERREKLEGTCVDRGGDNIKMDFEETGSEAEKRIHPAQDRD